MPTLQTAATTELPVWIDPCPIVEVVTEIRFQTQVPPQAVAGVVYSAMRDEFPRMVTLPAGLIPFESRAADPNLKYQPENRLEGDRGVVLVSPQHVMFGPRSVPYPGWPALLQEFNAIVALLTPTDLVQTVDRFGLRYVNFFGENILPRLTLSLAIAERPITELGTFLRTIMADRACKLVLQVGSGMALTTKPTEIGSTIDIDAYVESPQLTQGLAPAFSAFLAEAHAAEKRLFFSLLTPELLRSLNPRYD
ncbi:MAG: hypothetical protein DME20_00065 [Verrucomicrobia bacterium]|nr:MAG: hypothetical protein DME20_00065 [Verrucomicrobiota bacterium]